MSNSPRPVQIVAAAAALALIAALAGCMGEAPQSTLHQNSDLARMTWDVYMLVTWITLAVGVVVFALLAYVVFRFRDRGEGGIPEQVHGNTRLEIAWTLVPLALVVAMAIPTIRTIFAAAAPAPEGAVKIKVVGKQWWWEFEYPELGVTTANEVHIPAGVPVTFEIVSADVIHSLWLPQFGGKRDAVPGRTNHLTFTARDTGNFVGQCAEYCGDSHALMELRLIVQEEADFQKWVQDQKAPAQGDLVASGKPGPKAFLDAGCIACHQVRGNPIAAGRIGPDLTHVASRSTIGSGIMDNDAEGLRRWLRDPEGVKPGSLMKLPHKLSEQEVETLTQYLLELK